ncbi:hypothetical protein KDL44_06820 [bacterium]|nr:hypothetical protein [bacterium]
MAVRKHLIRLMLAAMATLFTCGQARAEQQIQRYNFELHGTEPLTGSRWEQPEHEVWRFLDAVEQFAAAHEHEGIFGAKLHNAWWNITINDEPEYCRAFLTLVVEDPALQDAALSWLRQQDGVQADTIKPELADISDPYVESPPVDFSINGNTYRFPGDFEGMEREWAESFARTNYPNQSLFIVHPPQAIAERFGLGELSRAQTFGDGQPIVISTLQEKFELGEIVIPTGMELYAQFLPTHLVPDTDEGLRNWLLGEIGRRVQWYNSSSNGGAGKWEVYGFPLEMEGESGRNSIEAARAVLDDWLVDYPLHAPGGTQFGNVTLQTISEGDRPVELLLRLYDIELEGKYSLLAALQDIRLNPQTHLATSDGLIGLGQPLEKVNQFGLRLADREGQLPDKDELQVTLEAYREYRASFHPPLAELALELSTNANQQPVLMTEMPSMAEMERMRGWLQAALPTHPDLSVSSAAWRSESMEQEAVSGFVEINGTRYQYPEDFAGVQARNLDSMLRYQPGGRAIALYSGIDFGEQNETEAAAQFALGDLAVIDIEEGGIIVTTIARNWEHGLDLSDLGLPPDTMPTMSGSMPSWIGMEPEAIKDYAKRLLAHSKSRQYEVMRQQQEPRRYSIVINPLPTTEQGTLAPGILASELSEEQKQATRSATRITWETLLSWLEESEGYSAEDAVMGEFDTMAPVTFQANDFGGFVQQIRIGIADASEEQLIELMDRICLATGMRDIWGRYNGNIYPSVVLDDTVASAGDS